MSEMNNEKQRKKILAAVEKLFKDPTKVSEFIVVSKSHMVAEKQSASTTTHRKQFKRFCKLFITGLVDMYPRRSHLLTHLTERLCLFLDCRQRLVRLTFL